MLVISKAFDKVWHDGLIYKLRQSEAKGNLLVNFLPMTYHYLQ